jgi:hypothetical protein
MSGAAPPADAALPAFRPETALEGALFADPDLRAGLAWGAPRPGHPEGSVGHHVAAILRCIDDRDPQRADLRVLALVHDAFKRAVDSTAGWSRDNDHAVLARRFAKRFTSDERLLVALESCTMRRTGCGGRVPTMRRSTGRWSGFPTSRCSCASSSSTRRRRARTSASCGGFAASSPAAVRCRRPPWTRRFRSPMPAWRSST